MSSLDGWAHVDGAANRPLQLPGGAAPSPAHPALQPSGPTLASSRRRRSSAAASLRAASAARLASLNAASSALAFIFFSQLVDSLGLRRLPARSPGC